MAQKKSWIARNWWLALIVGGALITTCIVAVVAAALIIPDLLSIAATRIHQRSDETISTAKIRQKARMFLLIYS